LKISLWSDAQIQQILDQGQ